MPALRRWSRYGALLALVLLAEASRAAADEAPIKVLVGDPTLARPLIECAGATIDDQFHLWLTADEFARATGFTLKPEGLCRAELCVPLPRREPLSRAAGEQTQVDLTAAAELLDLAVATDVESGVWCLGEAQVGRGQGLASGVAPDFAVPDRQGNIVRLSQFRGKKVLVITWASW
ncbi:MAG: hypothetical protein K1X74_18950 [Pirellulales bacterium]|nr:hypothetical protein [Pirellulales bacterium]